MKHIWLSASGIILLIILAGTSIAFALSWGEQVFAREGEFGDDVSPELPANPLGEAVSQIPHVADTGAISQVITRTISVNSGGFLFDTTSTDIRMTTNLGLRWVAGSTDEAGFYVHHPADWDGTSPIEVMITFALGGNQAGTVNWRLKLNTYTPNSGEWLTNPASRDADEILTFADGVSWYRIYSQTFTLDPQDFNEEPYWSLYFLRGSGANGETFSGDLYVMGADIEYQAFRQAGLQYLPILLR